MNYNPILIVAAEPNSVFLEIFFKTIKNNKINSPIILISSKKLLVMQMKKLKFKKTIKILYPSKLDQYKLNNKTINLLNVEYSQNKAFEKISTKSNKFIEESFKLAFDIIKKNDIKKFINGPISKKNFLNKRFLGITEFISEKFSVKENCMLIYNKELSVCPITTHLPLKKVSKQINKNLIKEKVHLIDNFYKIKLKTRPKIGVLGLNPHCESVHKYNEDEKIIKPAIKNLKKNMIFLDPILLILCS